MSSMAPATLLHSSSLQPVQLVHGYKLKAFGGTFGRWCGQIKKPAQVYLRRLSGSQINSTREREEGSQREGELYTCGKKLFFAR